MACEKFEELLAAYADGELGPGERAVVERHLEACPGCAALLASLRTADAALARFPEVEPPADLSEKLQTIPARRRFRFGLDVLLRPALQPAFAAAAVCLTLFTFYLFSPAKAQINKAVSRQFHLGYSQVEKLYAKAGSITDSLGGFADNVFVSLKKINPLSKNDE